MFVSDNVCFNLDLRAFLFLQFAFKQTNFDLKLTKLVYLFYRCPEENYAGNKPSNYETVPYYFGDISHGLVRHCGVTH